MVVKRLHHFIVLCIFLLCDGYVHERSNSISDSASVHNEQDVLQSSADLANFNNQKQLGPTGDTPNVNNLQETRVPFGGSLSSDDTQKQHHSSSGFINSKDHHESFQQPGDIANDINKRVPPWPPSDSHSFNSHQKAIQSLTEAGSLNIHKDKTQPHYESIWSADRYTAPKSYREIPTENPDSLAHIGCPAFCHCSYHLDEAVDVVDCSHRRLRTIPELPKTSSEIYLQKNIITSITSDQFKYLNVLRILDLSQNNLTKIRNDTFQHLSSLRILSLQGNKLRYEPGTFEARAFHGLSSLETLHLEGNQPKFSDDFIYPDQTLARVSTLRHLWLDGYPLALGPGFSYLVQLSTLSFSSISGPGGFCLMTFLPSHFFYHLATRIPLRVDLSGCHIHHISREVFKFVPTLDTLDLSCNQQLTIDGFEKASEGLQNSNLTFLNISQITDGLKFYGLKNTTFRHLKNTSLEALVADTNGLFDIDPQAILDLPTTLQFVSFRYNYIAYSFWIYSFTHLVNLKTVKISNKIFHPKEDQLHQMLAPLGGTPVLKISTLKAKRSRHARLKQFPQTSEQYQGSIGVFERKPQNGFINGIAALKGYDNNYYKSNFALSLPFPLPRSLENLYAKISLPEFPFIFATPNIINNKVLKHADISNSYLINLRGVIRGVPSLEYLDFSGSSCEYISPLLFSEAVSLKTLRLNHNKLDRSLANDTEGVIFSNLTLLEHLDLSVNFITDLSERAFERNENLQILNLSNNALIRFQPSLVNNNKLQVLNLSFNQLVGFSKSTCLDLLEIKRNNSKFTVNIRENKFSCRCENLYFLNFLLEHPDIFDDTSTFHCVLVNGSRLSYDRLADFIPHLSVQCVAENIFTGVLIAFFTMVGILAVFCLYHYKRWQWKYLYYVGRSRLHIGSTYITYRPVAHAFVTYDQVRHTWGSFV